MSHCYLFCCILCTVIRHARISVDSLSSYTPPIVLNWVIQVTCCCIDIIFVKIITESEDIKIRTCGISTIYFQVNIYKWTPSFLKCFITNTFFLLLHGRFLQKFSISLLCAWTWIDKIELKAYNRQCLKSVCYRVRLSAVDSINGFWRSEFCKLIEIKKKLDCCAID